MSYFCLVFLIWSSGTSMYWGLPLSDRPKSFSLIRQNKIVFLYPTDPNSLSCLDNFADIRECFFFALLCNAVQLSKPYNSCVSSLSDAYTHVDGATRRKSSCFSSTLLRGFRAAQYSRVPPLLANMQPNTALQVLHVISFVCLQYTNI